jgi:hypothetical protein
MLNADEKRFIKDHEKGMAKYRGAMQKTGRDDYGWRPGLNESAKFRCRFAYSDVDGNLSHSIPVDDGEYDIVDVRASAVVAHVTRRFSKRKVCGCYPELTPHITFA